MRALLRAPKRLGGDLAAELRPAAEKMVGLLPNRLRRSQRWLLAGAAAGALGGLTAALLGTPTAVGSLPLWPAVGAAIAGLIQQETSNRGKDVSAPNSMEYGDAVRAAALFCLLLEFQGREEIEITRLLDRTLDPKVETMLDSIEAVRRWLDELRHRYNVALAEETTR